MTTKDRSRKRAVMAEGWGGRFGRSLLCPGRAERETRCSWPTTRCLPVNRTNFVPIRGVMRKEFDTGQTDRQTHTHTHGIKAPWTARSPALARTWPPARIKLYNPLQKSGQRWKRWVSNSKAKWNVIQTSKRTQNDVLLVKITDACCWRLLAKNPGARNFEIDYTWDSQPHPTLPSVCTGRVLAVTGLSDWCSCLRKDSEADRGKGFESMNPWWMDCLWISKRGYFSISGFGRSEELRQQERTYHY